MTCSFCAQDNLRITRAKQLALLIHDKNPVTPGHSLVIPRRHVTTIFDCTKDEIDDLYILLAEYRDELKGSDPSITGFNIGINEGASAGQTIEHLHIHLIPRRDGDTKKPRGGVRGVIPDKMNY